VSAITRILFCRGKEKANDQDPRCERRADSWVPTEISTPPATEPGQHCKLRSRVWRQSHKCQTVL